MACQKLIVAVSEMVQVVDRQQCKIVTGKVTVGVVLK
jgi:hypothetical protein